MALPDFMSSSGEIRVKPGVESFVDEAREKAEDAGRLASKCYILERSTEETKN